MAEPRRRVDPSVCSRCEDNPEPDIVGDGFDYEAFGMAEVEAIAADLGVNAPYVAMTLRELAGKCMAGWAAQYGDEACNPYEAPCLLCLADSYRAALHFARLARIAYGIPE
jgi:hypothetical protein